MNRAAHTLLGLALAIVFPAFVFYAAVTFIPDVQNVASAPAYPNITEPTPPQDCDNIATPTITPVANAANTNYSISQRECASEQATYNAQESAYNQAQANYTAQEQAYENSLTNDDSRNTDRIFYRSLMALGIALVGIVVVLVLGSVPTLIYGLASGAGLTLIGGIIGVLYAAGDNLKVPGGATLMGVFVVSAGLLYWYEHHSRGLNITESVPPKPASAVTPLPEPPAQTRASEVGESMTDKSPHDEDNPTAS